MSFGNNKVLKVTRWSSRSAATGNWTYNWFGGRRLLRHFNCLGAAIRFLGTSCFSRSLSDGTSKGALVFGGLTAGLGMVRLSDRLVCSGMWMGSGLPLEHAGSLLFRRCLLFLLKIFPSSVLTSYDLTSTCCSKRALNHLPDLSVGLTRTISPLPGGGGGVPWH